MLNYSKTRTSIYQEAREASRDTLHALARDDVYRRRLGALAQRQDGASTTSAAEAIMASFRTVNQLEKSGAEKTIFDKAIAVFYCVPDVTTIEETDPVIIIERAQIASLWYVRCDGDRQNGDRVSFSQIYPDVPLLPQTAFTLNFHVRVAAINFNVDYSSRELVWDNFAFLTGEGAEVYAQHRARFPRDATVWAPTPSNTGRAAVSAQTVFNSIPENAGPQRVFQAFHGQEHPGDPFFSMSMPSAIHTDANSFRVIEPSFFSANLQHHCGVANNAGRNPIEQMNAVIESVQRWFRDNQQHRMAPLSDKQLKSWVLADAGPRGQGSAFALENLIPQKRISSLGDLTNAVALFVEVEVFMRGTHMNIIADAFLTLVRIGQRRQNFGPRTMAMLLENRHLRLRAPVKIPMLPNGPTRNTDAELMDEAYERARAAFVFDRSDRDLREAKDDPLTEDHDTRSLTRNSHAQSSQSNAVRAPSRPRHDAPMSRCPPPKRLIHLNGVCFQWITTKNEVKGRPCDKHMCRFEHEWPTTATDDQKSEFRKYVKMDENERWEFLKT